MFPSVLIAVLFFAVVQQFIERRAALQERDELQARIDRALVHIHGKRLPVPSFLSAVLRGVEL